MVEVFVPYVKLYLPTRIALIEHEVTFISLTDGEWSSDWDIWDVSEPRNYAYQSYWNDRWVMGHTFINVEQDVVPWAGALEELAECPEPWCAFNYHLKCHRAHVPMTLPNGYPPTGCCKVSAEAISMTEGLWEDLVMWDHCDGHLADGLREAGLDVHPHYPGVVNANPALLQLAAGRN